MKIIKSNKKGVSGIVATVIMIALVIAIGGVVWMVVNNLVSEQLEDAGSCFDIFEKIEINNKYTCWNSTSDANEFLFSVKVKDIDISKLVVSISGDGTTKSYTLTPEGKSIEGLKTYPDRDDLVKMPGKNEGLTYITTDFSNKPDFIEVSPVVGKKQCDSTDTLNEIDTCYFFE